jgi:hypothetical protein
MQRAIKDVALPFWRMAMEGCQRKDFVFSVGLKPVVVQYAMSRFHAVYYHPCVIEILALCYATPDNKMFFPHVAVIFTTMYADVVTVKYDAPCSENKKFFNESELFYSECSGSPLIIVVYFYLTYCYNLLILAAVSA